MQQRFFCPLLAAAALLTALTGADRASAAIRITISDGTTDKVFYSTSSQSALFATDLGAFDLVLHTTLTNFPGQDSGGALSQTINLSDASDPSGGTLPTFTFTSEVIVDVAGVSSGQVTNPGQLAAVQGAALARFTLPASTLLRATSDVSSAEPTFQAMAGTVQNHTNVNGTTVSSLEVGVNSTTEADTFADIPNDPAVGYTLTSQVVLENANVGVTGLAISASSGVVGSPAEADLVPEPVSAAVWGLGALGLVLAGAARRRRHHRRK
jgi:MYXO-CTERM domain-containing protein